jgi:photosystem II stability/assembly factor-like uncharacterized protein
VHGRVVVAACLVLVCTLVIVPSPSGASAVLGKLALQQFTPSSRSTWWAVMEPTVTYRSFVFRTVDEGRTWRNVSPTTGALESTYFWDSDTGWVVTQVAHGSVAPVYETVNGGRTWRELGSVSEYCTLEFVDRQHGWCTVLAGAAGSEGVQIYRTSDGGVSWSVVTETSLTSTTDAPGTLPGGCDKTLTFTSPRSGWASFICNGGTASLYETSDGGSSWQAVSPPKPLDPTQGDFGESLGPATVEGSNITLAVNSGERGETEIATSTNGGVTWILHRPPGPPQRWNVDVIDSLHWRLSNGKSLLTTDDEGGSWHTWKPMVKLKDPISIALNVRFLSPRVGWVVPDPDGGTLSWTQDAGAHWRQIRLPERL